MCNINGIELSVKQHTLSYVVGIGGRFRSKNGAYIKAINICSCLYINLYLRHHLPAGENTSEISSGVFGAFRQAGLLANGSSTRRGYPSKSDSTCKKPISSAFRISKTWLLASKIHRILTKQSIFLQNVRLPSLDPTELLLTCIVYRLVASEASLLVCGNAVIYVDLCRFYYNGTVEGLHHR